MAIFIVPLVIYFFVIFFVKMFLRKESKGISLFLECAFVAFYITSFLLFGLELSTHHAPYHKAIDPVNDGYSPFSEHHVWTLITFFILFLGSSFLLWIRGRRLPPLIFVFSMVFMIIGTIISIPVMMQLSKNSLDNNTPIACILPLFNCFISIALITKIILKESLLADNRIYQNAMLQFLNGKLADARRQTIWIFILLIPAFVLTTCILVVFGQQYNSLVKVFTDTTTWYFSQKNHPPLLDHHGHYLCTVAACGSPSLVKPLHLGTRNGHVIIVNRQLKIANAFEEMLHHFFPTGHAFSRKIYDRYGYPLSRQINNRLCSNTTYLAMKPLEWFFVIALYMLWVEPEKLISKQYHPLHTKKFANLSGLAE